MMPHASSGWSALACATIASTISAGMRNTPIRVSRIAAAATARPPAAPAPSVQHGRDQRILHGGEPAVGGVHRSVRRSPGRRAPGGGSSSSVISSRTPERQPDVVQRRDPGVRGRPRRAGPGRRRGAASRAARTAAASFAAIRSGSCSTRRPADSSASSAWKSGSSRATAGSVGRRGRADGHPGELGQRVDRASRCGGRPATAGPGRPGRRSARPRRARSRRRTCRTDGGTGRTGQLSRAMVAHRPAPCSLATSASIFSRGPMDTVARPLWCTSSISASAFGRG